MAASTGELGMGASGAGLAEEIAFSEGLSTGPREDDRAGKVWVPSPPFYAGGGAARPGY